MQLLSNGIPDAVELRLLQRLLQDPQYNLISAGGASHLEVWDAWEKNVSIPRQSRGL
jgi:hypothetical protein